MNLAERIFAHARALPSGLQRQAMDFIVWLEERHRKRAVQDERLGTTAFIERHAGSLGDDFPDDIDDADLSPDAPREPLA
jgi:hypothetical protein